MSGGGETMTRGQLKRAARLEVRLQAQLILLRRSGGPEAQCSDLEAMIRQLRNATVLPDEPHLEAVLRQLEPRARWIHRTPEAPPGVRPLLAQARDTSLTRPGNTIVPAPTRKRRG